jgi:hypothetical protein
MIDTWPWVGALIKTFITGMVLGVVAAVAALAFVPFVDQHRENSIISVLPNGGNTEAFHVNVPNDRIMTGAPAQPSPVPPDLDWPQDLRLAGTRAELFKLRNGRDVVVGVASRIAAVDTEAGDIIEWTLHLPARGSAYVTMQADAAAGGHREGVLRAGTREFRGLRGSVTERWIATSSNQGGSASEGRIELTAKLVATADEAL